MQINNLKPFPIETFESAYGSLTEGEKNLDLNVLAARIEHLSQLEWWKKKHYHEPFITIKLDQNNQPLPYLMEENAYKANLSFKEKCIHYGNMASGFHCQQIIECANQSLATIRKIRDTFWKDPLDPVHPFLDLSKRCKRLQIMLDEELFWTTAVRLTRKSTQNKVNFLKKWKLPDFLLNKLRYSSAHLNHDNLGLLTPKDFIARKEFCFTNFSSLCNGKEIQFSIKGILPHFNAEDACDFLRFETTYRSNPLNEEIAASFDIQKKHIENHEVLTIHDWQSQDSDLFRKLFQFAIEIFEREGEHLQVNSYDLKTACLFFTAGMTTLDEQKDRSLKNRLKEAPEGNYFSGENEELRTTFFIYKKSENDIVRFYTDPQGTNEAKVYFERNQPTTWNVYLEGRRMLTQTSELFPKTRFQKLNHIYF